MSNKKSILIVIGMILVLAVLAYFAFFSGNKTPSQNTDEEETGAGIFPGSGISPSASPEENLFPEENPIEIGILPESTALALRKIVDIPTAGFGIVNRNEEIFVRYVERATGHIYEKSLTSSSAERLSNNTIPKVYEAFWSSDGNTAIIRYLRDKTEDIESFSLKMSPSTTTASSVQGSYLARNISALSVLPNSNSVFYVNPSGESYSAVISRLDGTGKIQIAILPTGEWVPQFLSEGAVYLNTKASSLSTGSLLSLNTKSGTMTKILDRVPGLTSLARKDGKKIIYSSSASESFRTSIFDTRENASVSLSLKTLPEKCVWSNKDSEVIFCAVPQNIVRGNYPERWYQGFVRFNDDIWKINTSTGKTELLSTIEEDKIDAIDLKLDKEEKNLLFMNRSTGEIWVLRLSN